MTWQPTGTLERKHRLAITLAVLVVAALALTVVASESATAEMQMGSLSVADTNQTVDADVSDVTLSADLSYEYDVPDADRRLVKLKAGTSRDDLKTITYANDAYADPTDSGTVTLSGSLVDNGVVTTEDVNPPVAGDTSTDIVVEAVLEIQRDNGETVTRTVTDTATLTLQDGASLEASIGGTGSLSVSAA